MCLAEYENKLSSCITWLTDLVLTNVFYKRKNDMIVIHDIARSIFVDKKGRKRKIMEEVREYCQIASNLRKK